MDPIILLLLLLVSPVAIASHISVTGSVFCDVCYHNSFTKHSYFLPGVDVHLQCKFQSKTSEHKITFSVNRTTNRYGVYRLDMPSVEGIECVKGPAIESFCEATLMGSSLPSCNVPAVSASSKEITVKSSSPSTNLCVYSVSALTYTPSKRNSTLCGHIHNNLDKSSSFNSSKFFLPYFPPWPPWLSLPPLPQLPPWPSLPPIPPLPPFPSFPPFQFPPLPPLPPLPSLPPVLNPGHPSPPPPVNPPTWIPFPIPPPPPGFNLRDPRTWFPPSPQKP